MGEEEVGDLQGPPAPPQRNDSCLIPIWTFPILEEEDTPRGVKMDPVDNFPFDDSMRAFIKEGSPSPKWRFAIAIYSQLWVQFMLLCCIITIPLMPVAAIAIYFWSHAYVKRYHFEFTEERIIVKRGVFTKRVVNLPYDRIQNVVISQGILERMAGVYSLNIETAGGTVRQSTMAFGSDAAIQGLEDPEPLKDFIHWMVKRTKEDVVDDGVSFTSARTGKDKTQLAMLRELQAISASLRSIEGLIVARDPNIDMEKAAKLQPISVQCPFCAHTFNARLGEKVKCPSCGEEGVVDL
jgi:membrane protein YdbS with pleckstrin-like domain